MKLSADKLQEYIDGRLSERDRATVAAYLLLNPDIALLVSRLQLLDDIMPSIGQSVLDEPVPDRLLKPFRQDLGGEKLPRPKD